MFEPLPGKTRRPGQIGVSVALHALIFALLLHAARPIRVRASLPGTTSGSKIELTYLPGGAPKSAPAIRKQQRTPPPQPKLAMPQLPATAPVPSPAAAEPSAGQTGTSGNDALGDSDIQIALTTYSPSPKPDLSQVPRGTQGDVVLDVTIDPTGNVADLQILHALGFGVEGEVANTVRTWKFRPAMKDGVPVASIQELHFHYGPV